MWSPSKSKGLKDRQPFDSGNTQPGHDTGYWAWSQPLTYISTAKASLLPPTESLGSIHSSLCMWPPGSEHPPAWPRALPLFYALLQPLSCSSIHCPHNSHRDYWKCIPKAALPWGAGWTSESPPLLFGTGTEFHKACTPGPQPPPLIPLSPSFSLFSHLTDIPWVPTAQCAVLETHAWRWPRALLCWSVQSAVETTGGAHQPSQPRTRSSPSSCGTFPSVAFPACTHPSSPRATSDPKALCSHTALARHSTDPSGPSHAPRHVAVYYLNLTLDAKAVRVETQLVSASWCIPGISDTATLSMTEWGVAVREISWVYNKIPELMCTSGLSC